MQKLFDLLRTMKYDDLCEILDDAGIYHHPCATSEKIISLIVEHIKP